MEYCITQPLKKAVPKIDTAFTSIVFIDKKLVFV